MQIRFCVADSFKQDNDGLKPDVFHICHFRGVIDVKILVKLVLACANQSEYSTFLS